MIINSLFLIEGVSTIPDECMEVGLEISTSDVLGNEASENRSGRQRDSLVFLMKSNS